MAQLSHPEFGGSGQWMAGGATMFSDMFNNALKASGRAGAGCRLGEGETYVGGSPSPSRERLRAWSPRNTEAMFILLARAA
jgi:hypothetical protein